MTDDPVWLEVERHRLRRRALTEDVARDAERHEMLGRSDRFPSGYPSPRGLAEALGGTRPPRTVLDALAPMREMRERLALAGHLPRHVSALRLEALGFRDFAGHTGLNDLGASLTERLRAIREGVGGLRASDLSAALAHQSPLWETAQRSAAAASAFRLPVSLRDFAVGQAALAERLALSRGLGAMPSLWADPTFGAAFSSASAFSNMLHVTGAVTPGVLAAARELSASDRFASLGTGTTLAMLDAAGLSLGFSRNPGLLDQARLKTWPGRTSPKQKRKRLRTMKKAFAAKTHQVRAFRNVNDTERLLRRFIERAMAETYGPEWADKRLPLCLCRDLLGKRDSRGNEVLENADWSHYRKIMGHGQHFEDIFSLGFTDLETLTEALGAAGRFRHRIMHFHSFTEQHLVELRVALATLEDGLMEMLDFFIFEDTEADADADADDGDGWELVE